MAEFGSRRDERRREKRQTRDARAARGAEHPFLRMTDSPQKGSFLRDRRKT